MEENAGQEEPALRIVEPGVTAGGTSTSVSSMLNVALDLCCCEQCGASDANGYAAGSGFE